MHLLTYLLTDVYESIKAFKADMNLDDVLVGPTLMRVAVLGVLKEYMVHVSTGVLEQLVCTAEHDQCNLTVTQHAQFIRFLHQTELALCERHLTDNKQVIITIAFNSYWKDSVQKIVSKTKHYRQPLI